ncbi:glycosyltransferase family 4 protein [Streptomonospora litoralis]|uniref:D-inositol 3-phosphate glycosyltransferase n=1 Tax=Streptomonospora litoralis TaxID=2498135 RepID=A0A4P6Q6Z4_9ACTN|nr:glycosyltransferase family 4 protein [Streptomonospora litoralis]QBI56556.1 D-inositol 3-phosphate glycosyltransferase [Streptomonospora litoralis]
MSAVPVGGPEPPAVHVVLPGGIDEAGSPSGGNVYDRRMCRSLTEAGRPVAEIAVAGEWPSPGPAARADLDAQLARLPYGTLVLADGLVCCGVPEIVVPHARRLRLAVLVHLPLAAETGLSPPDAADLDAREGATLRAAAAVVATSPGAARRLVERHGLDPARTGTVEPGVDPAPLASGTDGAARLLCVASLTPRKGHDVLVDALAGLADRDWTCVCAGPSARSPDHVAAIRGSIASRGMADRVQLAGPLRGAALAAAYAAADLFVLPSRDETYGMAVAEALARGIPVMASDAGALPQTVGTLPDGAVPGVVVPADDASALAAALRDWFDDPALRERLRGAARRRRRELRPWSAAAARMDAVLRDLARVPR